MPTLPSPQSIIDGISIWATPFFNVYLPWIFLAIGVLAGALIVVAIKDWVLSAIYTFLHNHTNYQKKYDIDRDE